MSKRRPGRRSSGQSLGADRDRSDRKRRSEATSRVAELVGGNFRGADMVGTLHDMRFVFLENDTKLLFATAYDGEWDAYIDDFVTKIPTSMDIFFCNLEGWPGIRQSGGEGLPRQAPDHGRRLVCRQSESDGSGDATAREGRQGGRRIPRQDLAQ